MLVKKGPARTACASASFGPGWGAHRVRFCRRPAGYDPTAPGSGPPGARPEERDLRGQGLQEGSHRTSWGRARPPHLLTRPAEGRLGTRGEGRPELVHGRCRGAGPLRRQSALWGDGPWSAGLSPCPSLCLATPTSPALLGRGVCRSPPNVPASALGGSGGPRSSGFSSSRSRLPLDWEGAWSVVGRAWARGGPQLGSLPWALGPIPFSRTYGIPPPSASRPPPAEPLPAFEGLPSAPLPTCPQGPHLAAAQASLQPVVTKLDLEGGGSLQELGPKEGRLQAGGQRQPGRLHHVPAPGAEGSMARVTWPERSPEARPATPAKGRGRPG